MTLIPEMLTHGEIWDQSKVNSSSVVKNYYVYGREIYTAASTTILKTFIFKAVLYGRAFGGTPDEKFYVANHEGPYSDSNYPTLILYIKPIVTTVLGEKIVIATGKPTSFEKTIILNPHDELILDVKNLDTAKDKITAVHYAIFGAKKI